jgi:outer membrane protein assembly factor BamB
MALVGHDRASGRELWRAELPAGVVTGEVAADDDHVYLSAFTVAASGGGTSSVVAYDRRTGAHLWDRPGVRLTVGRTAADGVVVVGDDAAGALLGLDGGTGAERWRREGVNADVGSGTLDIADGRFLLESRFGVEIAAVATGAVAALLGGSGTPQAIRADGIVLDAFDSGLTGSDLVVYSLDDGHRIGTVPRLRRESDQVAVPPQIGPDGTVFLGRGCPGRG